ncbi:hypothetical protein AM593_05231, partial [Mytilus galloprovincialis]
MTKHIKRMDDNCHTHELVEAFANVENGGLNLRERDYPSALLIYLLKKEKWEIREEQLTFHQRILNYIYEEEFSHDQIIKLWQSFSNMRKKHTENKTEDKSKQTDLDPKCYGLTFLTLLKKHSFGEAMKLIETGNTFKKCNSIFQDIEYRYK